MTKQHRRASALRRSNAQADGPRDLHRATRLRGSDEHSSNKRESEGASFRRAARQRAIHKEA
eukprot:6178239-Pleurochrysis_carterae.AAC.2